MKRGDRTLADLGETALIERIARRAALASTDRPSAASPAFPRGRWALGIGDDAAILRTRANEELVFSTDAQVENVHFRFGRETPRTIGRRALAVNLSDLAAMGAEPVGTLMSLSAPSNAPVSVFDALVRGFLEEAKTYACPLVGGNLSRAGEWSLHVTVIGRCARGRALRRSGVRDGDGLFVTGVLGAAALARLKADRNGTSFTRVPTPRIEEGKRLARLSGVRACLDISDGLATDLSNLLRADGLGAEIEASDLPRPRGFDRGCRSLGLDPLQVLCGGGEDYELLFAFRSERKTVGAAQLSKRLGVPVHRIGTACQKPGLRGIPVTRTGHHF